MQLAGARKSRTFYALAVGWALIGLTASASPASIPGSSDQLLVAFRPNLGPAEIASTLSSAGATDSSVIKGIGVHVVTATGAHHALTALRNNPNVLSAEPDSVLEPQEVLPNDPYFLNSGA
jgi:hypothetical protein